MRFEPDTPTLVDPTVPGPDLPPVRPPNDRLPWPPPSLDGLVQAAVDADPAWRSTPGAHPSTFVNAHYTNTRTQLAWALTHHYNTFEGDVRMRDGVPVMQHDATSERDLTFEQWALVGARSHRHLRVDLKEGEATAPVEAILARLGVDDGLVTFNVGVLSPWSAANQSIEAVRALKARHPRSWFSINLALPFGPVYEHARLAARLIGGDRLGTTVLAGVVTARDAEHLRRSFAYLNAWNIPFAGDIDIPSETARLRAIGVNGMIDLRRRDDPLADDD
ncbi:MAG: hypothetical protein JWM98_1035 [Thermoleophilia bacterium]|nr:hypothetical protein [Thermoleophilia bacterium]